MKRFSQILVILSVSCCFLLFFGFTPKHQSTSQYSIIDSLSKQEAAIMLGRYLFYDTILSRDSSLSCGSCHHQNKAFTDGEVTSLGFKGQRVNRNAPTLLNVVNRKMFLLDGVNPSLESQATVPIQEHKEFDFHILLIAERLKQNPLYVQLSQKAYGELPNPQVITASIATFERQILSNRSPYDEYLAGNKNAISSEAKKGAVLFHEQLYCGKCHSGPDLTNDSIANNGLYDVYKDQGRYRLTEKEKDIAVFKVPTLRNITMTAPYMHDGSFNSLEEVLIHYQSGGRHHTNKSQVIQPFKLNKKETKYLIAFFHSLTDSTVLFNEALSDPFK